MRRTVLGIMSLSLFLGAGAIYSLDLTADYPLVFSACIRMGMVLGAMWLAYDQASQIIRRTPPWVLGGALLGLIVVVIRPRAIIAVGPLLASAAALHWVGKILKPTPRKKQVDSQPPRSRSD